MTTESIICKNVCKKYKDKVVLENVNLELEPGKIYGMIGRNGVGKTTLLSMISAQNPVTSGEITLGGKRIWENEEALSHICFSREIATGTGYGANALKVKEYLKMASAFYPNWDKQMADKLVGIFGLDIKKKMMKLSKGMLSMVTIIVALASKADYTFLDEPVAGLDVVARDIFYKQLIEEYSNTGRTFVVSSHIIDEASDIFEETVILHNKEILLKENTVNLLERAVHVSGRAEAVDAAVAGKCVYGVENLGRSKGVTVLLNDGETILSDGELSVQKVSLQNLFVAICGADTNA
jgi:ABC-2 type transport system ATP-binding protein